MTDTPHPHRRPMLRRAGHMVLLACAALLAGCLGGGSDDGPAPLLPTLSEEVLPEGTRIDVASRDFFPMASGDRWDYQRSLAGVATGEIQRSVSAAAAADGSMTVTEQDMSTGTVGTATWRTTADGVWLSDPFGTEGADAGIHAALRSVLAYPTPFYPAGGVRRVVRQGSLGADIDGDGRDDFFRAEFRQVFRGFEPLNLKGTIVETAHFGNTLTLTVRTTADNGTRIVIASEEAYFASGLGLVRSDRSARDSGDVEVIAPYRLELFRGEVSARMFPMGLAWRERTSNVSGTLFAITASPTSAVAVGALGTIVTSTDGASWTPRTSGVSLHLNGAATSGSTYVAVGDGGTIVGSTDLGTWTARASGTTNRLLAVTWTGSQFVAVGESGTVLTSPDGAAWASRSSGTLQHLRAVAGHAGLVVAGGDGALITSADGQRWTARLLPGRTSGLVWSGTQFIAVGEFSSSGFGKTRAASFDGIDWTLHDGGYGNEMLGAAWSGGEFVAVGTFGVSVMSSDGISWAGSGDGSFGGDLYGVAFFNGTFIAVGSGGRIVAARQPAPVGATLLHVASSGTQVIAVGALGTIRTSADGIAWVARRSGSDRHLRGVAALGPRAVAVGDAGTILTSDDLETWVPRQSGTSRRLRAVAWNGRQYVAVGDVGTVLTSPDGLSWSDVSTGVTSDLLGVGGHAEAIVAVGTEGTMLSSGDGITWVWNASFAGNVLTDVVWSGTQFLVSGNNPNGLTQAFQTSYEAVTWTPRNGAIGNGVVAAAWSGSRFAAVGAFATAQTSADGIAWTLAMPAADGADLNGVAWHIDRFLAVGQFGKVAVLP